MGPPLSPRQLYELYCADALVAHTIAPGVMDKHASQMSEDDAAMRCGSLLLHGGWHTRNGHQPDAVARFGPDVNGTVFATLHSLPAVFDHHATLEARKPPEQRREPFVIFSNSDVADLVKRACDVSKEAAAAGVPGAHPGQECEQPWSYLDCRAGATLPVPCQRTRTFDFRGLCEHAAPADPIVKEDGCAWNELRAALCAPNLVGLLYLHDPSHDPRAHVEAAKRLQHDFAERLGGVWLTMGVFRLQQPDGCTGELLLTRDEGAHEAEEPAGPGEGGQEKGQGQQGQENGQQGEGQGQGLHPSLGAPLPGMRLLTFQEYLQQIYEGLREGPHDGVTT